MLVGDQPERKDVEVQEGDILAGKYCVEKIVGAGGMGVVVAATHTVLQNRVALKFLLPSVAKHEQTALRFLREAQAAVKIKSPHVARVIDVGQMEETGSPYMVMEYLEGRDLGEVLEGEGRFDVQRACLFALQTCEALAAAHASGIIHRDIKPANLFLTSTADGSPMIKVLDFGISKNILEMGVSNLTQTQVSMGSPLYMSPEQMRSARDVDARTDVWSIGVVLYEMVTGQLPFVAETMPQLCALVLENVPPRVDALKPELPENLALIIARCLEKDRDLRFANVGELAEALAEFVPVVGMDSAQRTSRIVSGAGLDKTGERPSLAGDLSKSSRDDKTPPMRLRGTETAFGRTRGSSRTPRSRRGLWLGAAVAVSLGAGAAVFILTSNPSPSSSAAASRALSMESTSLTTAGKTEQAELQARKEATEAVHPSSAETNLAGTDSADTGDPSGASPDESSARKGPEAADGQTEGEEESDETEDSAEESTRKAKPVPRRVIRSRPRPRPRTPPPPPPAVPEKKPHPKPDPFGDRF